MGTSRIYSVTNFKNIDLRKLKVKNCPDLLTHERETHIYFNDEDDYAVIETYQIPWINYLRKHEYFRPKKAWLTENNELVGLDGEIPKNCVRLSKRPRSRFDKM